jgi:hypothetical protein
MTNDELVDRLRDRHAHTWHSGALPSIFSAAADEIERLTGIVLCLTRRWPDCNANGCGQPCRPAGVTS